jgi:hypothetical protein
MMLFRVNDSDRPSLCRVSSAEAIVVRLLAADEIVDVANVQCVVCTAEKVNPRHSDDDAIVD